MEIYCNTEDEGSMYMYVLIHGTIDNCCQANHDITNKNLEVEPNINNCLFYTTVQKLPAT